MSAEPLSERLFQALEENAQFFSSMNEEMKFQFKTILDAQVNHLGLVTREEFDALRVSLDRALARIEKLESED